MALSSSLVYSGGGTGVIINQVALSSLKNLNARTELAGAWISYGYNRVKGRASSACLFHCVGMLHAAPAVYAAKLDSTPLVVMDINLDSALGPSRGAPGLQRQLPRDAAAVEVHP